MDILMLIEASHTLGKDRGFWKNKKDLREEILYIFSNIGDIAKSFKKEKRADWKNYDRELFILDNSIDIDSEEYIKSSRLLFKTYIKDTFEDEITNVILRITDLFGGENINIETTHPWTKPFISTEINYFFRQTKPQAEYKGKLAQWLNESLSSCLFSSDGDLDYGLSHILFYLGALIEFYDIDIENHIIKKIEYNRKRALLYLS